MTQSPLLSSRLQHVLNQLEKIIDELDRGQEPETRPCACPHCSQEGR